MSFRCYDGTRQTQATTDVELNQMFIVVRMRAVADRRWTGKDGFQAARQADEHTGWQARTGW